MTKGLWNVKSKGPGNTISTQKTPAHKIPKFVLYTWWPKSWTTAPTCKQTHAKYNWEPSWNYTSDEMLPFAWCKEVGFCQNEIQCCWTTKVTLEFPKIWNVVWGSDSMCARRPFKSLGATFCADGDGEHPVNFLNFATWVASMTWMCSIPAHTGGYSHDILCLDLWKYNISNYHLYCGSICICRYKKIKIKKTYK